MTDDERIARGRSEGWVYFVQAGPKGHIKVGWSKNPDSRIRALQTSNASKLQLLGAIPGSKSVESEIHHRFKNHRVSGEWFRRPAILNDAMKLILGFGFIGMRARESRNIPEGILPGEYYLLIPEV